MRKVTLYCSGVNYNFQKNYQKNALIQTILYPEG